MREILNVVSSSKAGSHSIMAAMQILGRTTMHFGSDRHNGGDALGRYQRNAKTPGAKMLDGFDQDCFLDFPTQHHFQRVIAEADKDTNVRTLLLYRNPYDIAMSFGRMIHRKNSIIEKDNRRWRNWSFAHHVENAVACYDSVFQFFIDYPEHPFMVMNVCEGDGWEKLCDFIGVPVPKDLPFPHKFNLNSLEGYKHAYEKKTTD